MDRIKSTLEGQVDSLGRFIQRKEEEVESLRRRLKSEEQALDNARRERVQAKLVLDRIEKRNRPSVAFRVVVGWARDKVHKLRQML